MLPYESGDLRHCSRKETILSGSIESQNKEAVVPAGGWWFGKYLSWLTNQFPIFWAAPTTKKKKMKKKNKKSVANMIYNNIAVSAS